MHPSVKSDWDFIESTQQRLAEDEAELEALHCDQQSRSLIDRYTRTVRQHGRACAEHETKIKEAEHLLSREHINQLQAKVDEASNLYEACKNSIRAEHQDDGGAPLKVNE